MRLLFLSDNFLYHKSHINSFVRVLILRNLDVIGLVVDLLLGDLLDDPGRLHFDSSTESISYSFTEFDNSPWISGFANRLRNDERIQVHVNT